MLPSWLMKLPASMVSTGGPKQSHAKMIVEGTKYVVLISQKKECNRIETLDINNNLEYITNRHGIYTQRD